MPPTLTLRCDAGGPYGLGHAMRLRAIARELHALAPEMQLYIRGTTQALFRACNDPWYVTSVARDEATCTELLRGAAVVIDMPQAWRGDRSNAFRSVRGPIIRIDAPWVTPDLCDVLILPGVHHGAETLSTLQQQFGERLYAGKEYVVLPNAPAYVVPWEKRDQTICFVAGGSDPYGILPRMYELSMPLEKLLPGVHRFFLHGKYAKVAASMKHAGISLLRYKPEYLCRAGLVVTAWGITAYECLAAQTPAMVVPQDSVTLGDVLRADMATGSALDTMGSLKTYSPQVFSQAIADLWNDTARRQAMHAAAAGFLDDQGATRIARIILDTMGARRTAEWIL